MMEHLHGSTAIAGVVLYEANQFPARVPRQLLRRQRRHEPDQSERAPRGTAARPKRWSSRTSSSARIRTSVRSTSSWDRTAHCTSRTSTTRSSGTTSSRSTIRGGIAGAGASGGSCTPAATPARRRGCRVATGRARATQELIGDLAHANVKVRLLATNELVDRGGPDVTAAVRRLVDRRSATPEQRASGLWILSGSARCRPRRLRAAARDREELVRVHALRILAESRTLSDADRAVAERGCATRAHTCAGSPSKCWADIRRGARCGRCSSCARRCRPRTRTCCTRCASPCAIICAIPRSSIACARAEWSETDSRAIADAASGISTPARRRGCCWRICSVSPSRASGWSTTSATSRATRRPPRPSRWRGWCSAPCRAISICRSICTRWRARASPSAARPLRRPCARGAKRSSHTT